MSKLVLEGGECGQQSMAKNMSASDTFG